MLSSSCSCCGKCGCQCGKLPYTMTVDLAGLKNKTHGNYCDLSFSSNFGASAAGVATSPGGCNGDSDSECGKIATLAGGKCDTETTFESSDRGPLTGVLLTEGGSCYARLGRVAPTLKADAAGGQDATFVVNTTKVAEAGTGFEFFEVSTITVSGGTDYTDGEAVTIRHSPGDTILTQATAKLVATKGVPSAVTVTTKGKYFREDEEAPPYVAKVEVTACGGGTDATIAATVDSKVGSPSFGKITGLKVTDGGSDYLAWSWINTARVSLSGESIVLRASAPEKLTQLHAEACYGTGFCGEIVPTGKREAPCITLTGNGTGTLSASLTQETDDDGLPYWKVGSASASGGKDYADTSPGTITLGAGTTREVSPEITLNASGGVLSGASIDEAGKVYIQYDYDGGLTEVKKVAVLAAGSGYAKLGREEPTLKFSGSGTGATFTPTLEAQKDSCDLDYWEITSVKASGGTKYTDGAPLTITLATSDDKSEEAGKVTLYTREEPTVTANAVSGEGSGASFSVTLTKSDDLPRTWGVSKLAITSGGSGYKGSVAIEFKAEGDADTISDAVATAAANDSGVIASVSLQAAGSYYLDQGVAIETETTDGGFYYRENKALPPYVASVSIFIDQAAGSDGSGAVITPTIESDTSSGKFGTITKLKITEAGSGYTLFGGSTDCTYTGPCSLALKFPGREKAPEVTLNDAVFRSSEAVGDCNALPEGATVLHSIGEGSVSLERGGVLNTIGGQYNIQATVPFSSCPTSSKCVESFSECGTPCTGPCDGCNPCAPGCACQGGECVPCCGPCEDSEDCAPGCVCVDGECEENPCDGPVIPEFCSQCPLDETGCFYLCSLAGQAEGETAEIAEMGASFIADLNKDNVCPEGQSRVGEPFALDSVFTLGAWASAAYVCCDYDNPLP